VLDSRTRPPGGRPISRRVSLLALLMLAALPAAAEAKNFKVDGRVTGTPTVRGGAVTVPLQLTRLNASRLALGTRSVRVKIKRRARLPLSGSAAAGATRLGASALRAGDRVRGVTKLTRKLRRRMRYAARPTLKLKRVRVVRNAKRLASPPGGGAPPAAPRTFEQALAEMPGRVMSLNAKVGEFGSLPQQIEAQKLQLEGLSTGLEGVTTAFESLTSAVEARPGFEGVLATVEGLVLRIEGLENSSSAVEDVLGQIESGVGTLGGALEELATMAPLLASQAALIKQFPGAEAQVLALDEALRRIEGRLAAAEAAIGSIGGSVGNLNAQMASVASQVNSVAATAAVADLATVQAAVNGLAGAVANLESAFAGLASVNGAIGQLAGLEADAVALEGAVEILCTSVPTACP
jgi:hypothetical protein